MAQDATGTPTSQGIPKYNTAADSPSGKGFNAAMDAIDALLVAKTAEIQAAAVPAGTIVMTGRSTAPTGWALCQGQELNRTTEAGLFAAIGTLWGVGDGATTFNVPDFKGRVPVGVDTGQAEFDAINEAGGTKAVTLTALESGVRAHSHGVTDPGHAHSTTDSSGNYLPIGYIGGGGGPINVIGSSGYNNGFVGISTNTTGVSIQNATAIPAQDAHTNLQPYRAVHYMIKK